ncbi:hypothetical protein NEOLEDRAFT_812038 [Neolentinus lepideus HHB14362 ss-1]|uniref:Uncharacterized protein n=1 Tax=Neolentinus lepideus HHB14362 ss-1 TaxID=1314782 RepID=A0A165PET8_9AGAM|nr:hypothetical protein NEOLEDRAFT_812038 [Neolentinus lepideus HHB14362 ss-1]
MISNTLPNRAAIEMTAATSTWLETCLMQGTILGGAAYGIVFSLHFGCMYFLHASDHRQKRRLMAYNGVIFSLATASFGLQDHWNQLLFIYSRGHSGGPAQFFIDHVDDWLNVASMAIQIVLNWLVDLLVLQQFWITHNLKSNTSKWERWLIMLPATMLLTSVALGSAFLAQLTHHGLSIYSTASTALAVCYNAVSVAFNVITTALIILQINRVGRASHRAQGGYMSTVVKILIESAALYTIVATLFAILYGVDCLLANALAPLLRQVQAICPLLISCRASMRRERKLRWVSSQQTITNRQPGSPYENKSHFSPSSPVECSSGDPLYTQQTIMIRPLPSPCESKFPLTPLSPISESPSADPLCTKLWPEPEPV